MGNKIFVLVLFVLMFFSLSSNLASAAFNIPSDYISWWRFEGNANDQNGINNGTVSGATYNATGKFGGDYEFSGTNYISIPDNPSFTLTNGYTISVWIKPSSVSGRRDIINQWGAGGAGYAAWLLSMGVATAGQISLYNYNGAGVGLLTNNALTLSTGNWYHVVGVYAGGTTGTNGYIYINGVLNKSGTIAAAPQDSSKYNVYIGAEAIDGTDGFIGSIDEVIIYNRSLVGC